MIDYVPDLTQVAGVDVAFGIIRPEHAGKSITATDAIQRRLRPGAGALLCHRHEVLLPPGAADMLIDLDMLVARYEAQLLPKHRDLIVMLTMRFAPGLPIHQQWELARGFVREKMVVAERLAVVLVQHQPGFRGFADGKPHVHAMALARRLENSHFLGFSPLVKEGAKAKLGAAWKDWLATYG